MRRTQCLRKEERSPFNPTEETPGRGGITNSVRSGRGIKIDISSAMAKEGDFDHHPLIKRMGGKVEVESQEETMFQ
jgi:hypothetical protein